MNHQNHSNLPPGNNSSTWNEHRWQFILHPRDPLKQTRKHRSLNIEWMMSRLRSHHIMKFNQNNVYKMVGFGGCWFKVATKGLQLDTLIFPNFNLRWNPRPVGTPLTWSGLLQDGNSSKSIEFNSFKEVNINVGEPWFYEYMYWKYNHMYIECTINQP